ncbi:ComF family protein [Staphylococcus sp. 17KM0847]|uniref:ComF family protein n=1 Tax=Staphylococcus sp. 17KM0847 TaxID=2583989 RepID=UPI0015DC9BC8|nr:ComF family protein [Staphylococcus sp. 17KM0847]QLK85526.1 ComF family protein [Staphylococcus sp. 17KM0847]
MSCSSIRFNHIYSCYRYTGIIREMLQQYKFMRDVALAEVIAQYMVFPRKRYDVIVPIPSSPSNDIIRTFNPVKYILDFKKIEYKDILAMTDRPKQFKLTQKERMNIKNSMRIKKEIKLENKSILLVDDIYTTGSTAHHAAARLFHKKVRRLDMLTFAR